MIQGFSGGYVNDMLRAGNEKFRQLAAKTSERFCMGHDEHIHCEFSGFRIEKDANGVVHHSQKQYLKQLETLPLDAPISAFRSIRMKLAWLSNTHPDCMFEISQLAQVTNSMFESDKVKHIKRLNRAVKFAMNHPITLKVDRLELDSLRVFGFSDASFANNHDLSTQLGHIVFLADKNATAIPKNFKSYKARRIVRSPMAAEVIAFSDMFDVAITLSDEIKQLYGHDIPLQLFTDSKSLFDVNSKGSRTSEKRLMLDIAAER